MYPPAETSYLLGKTFIKVEQVEDNELRFYLTDTSYYCYYHEQDCCESVYIESIVGDLSDLVGSEILVAEESTTYGEGTCGDTYTHTFYKFATRKGYVDVRWNGESNGYYSEKVYLKLIEHAK